MTYNFLLDAFCDLCRSATSNFELPVQPTRDDSNPDPRAPVAHKMRLPNSRSYTKEAPYMIVQFLTMNKDIAQIRIIFCNYSDNEEEGAVSLLNVMDAVRIKICKAVAIGGSYIVVRDENNDPALEMLVYPDDTAPFYGGEISVQVKCPAVRRECSPTQDFSTALLSEAEAALGRSNKED